MHKEGYGIDFINKTVEIDGDRVLKNNAAHFNQARAQGILSAEKELERMKNRRRNYRDLQTPAYGKQIEEHQARIKKMKSDFGHFHMDTQTIIEFYEYLISEDGKGLAFDNEKTYKDVSDALEAGTFTPDRQTPELLPIQKEYRSDNYFEMKEKIKKTKDFSMELVISD